MKHVTTIGLDLAKQIFQVHGADADGAPVFNRRLRRGDVLRFFERQPPCLVGIEACGSSHYWAREIAVRLGNPACAAKAEQSGDPRERHRCSAWRYGAVYKEWCRSLGALPFPNAGQWLGSTPAGCEVCREACRNESSALDTICPHQLLTEIPSCEAGHMTAPFPGINRLKKILAYRGPFHICERICSYPLLLRHPLGCDPKHPTLRRDLQVVALTAVMSKSELPMADLGRHPARRVMFDYCGNKNPRYVGTTKKYRR